MGKLVESDDGWLTFPVLSGARGKVSVLKIHSPTFSSFHVGGHSTFMVDFGRGESKVQKDVWDELWRRESKRRKDGR